MIESIVIQGTTFNAGKSILAAGLCRILMQDGCKTAPFKSQNMALNPYITSEGLEMGRAQMVQVEVVGVPPPVDMGPILFKPTMDVGSQVIVHGISRGNMKTEGYFAIKRSPAPNIMTSYERLSKAYDIIVIEGAGNPAEINLKSDDIINMGPAALADASVLLVGDIDRGGMFTQLYGTIALSKQEKRDRVKSFVINKFRGDKSILDPGVHMLEELCHILVARMVPYMDVDIEDEDSLSTRLNSSRDLDGGGSDMINLAIIHLPRISNFMDSDVFLKIPEVSFRYVARVFELGALDMAFLSGTKNIVQDLLWVRQNGLKAAMSKLADRQVPVWGIYGGRQMMGGRLKDSQGVEPDGNKEIAGMGLLPLGTEFYEEKMRTQVEGSFGELDGMFQPLSGVCIEGYKVHMGGTVIDREDGAMDTAWLVSWRQEPEICRPMVYLMEKQTGEAGGDDRGKVKTDGWSRGNVYGAYAHGVLDAPDAGESIVSCLAKKKGLSMETVTNGDYRSHRGRQYGELADILKASLDMDVVYGTMGLPPRDKN